MTKAISPDTSAARRFGGIARLYGDAGLARLQAASVCVIGVGGVGSWVAESLARSAVGSLRLIDMDIVAESNINRQILADEESLGRDKVAVMRERILRINPSCEVCAVDEFIGSDNLAEQLGDKVDYVVDCIDDFRIKAALIAHCKRYRIRLICIGGAGGQRDPRLIREADMSRTQHDVLLAKTRKLLRQEYGFARNPKRSFGVACIYSDEQLVYPDGAGGLSAQRPVRQDDTPQSNALNCAGGLGSVTHVTAAFGLFASAHVINKLVCDVVG
ncbi:MAG: tRNA threonylcarbamoyladenosine dehydratase [Gammaproteobacteria bacterium]|nr:tRNA threonylcarbamoyladenosine dehydratase [Gammaproteobacteria bacterium]